MTYCFDQVVRKGSKEIRNSDGTVHKVFCKVPQPNFRTCKVQPMQTRGRWIGGQFHYWPFLPSETLWIWATIRWDGVRLDRCQNIKQLAFRKNATESRTDIRKSCLSCTSKRGCQEAAGKSAWRQTWQAIHWGCQCWKKLSETAAAEVQASPPTSSL